MPARRTLGIDGRLQGFSPSEIDRSQEHVSRIFTWYESQV